MNFVLSATRLYYYCSH